jgi:hypothetical protein
MEHSTDTPPLTSIDALHHLSNRAVEALLAILDNPKSSPAVLLRTSIFILQRPHNAQDRLVDARPPRHR